MLSYSVAIRTLGKGGEIFRRELTEIAWQTVPPERVLIYMAEGYRRPDFQIGKEEYVWVKKGMMSQRLRPYDEIDSDCILMLDDDVSLQPDSVEKMLKALEQNNADCVGADTFSPQSLPLSKKLYAAVANLVFPHWDDRWAFKIRKNGSFSYNMCPKRNFYWSQSCAGNAMLWRKSAYEKLQMQDEWWLDDFPFAYNDDMLESYKVYRNGLKLGVMYDSGMEHRDVKSASSGFHQRPDWLYFRTKINLLIWMRTCCRPGNTTRTERWCATFSFFGKSVWLFMVMAAVSVLKCSFGYLAAYLRGWRDGWKYVRLDKYKELNPYFIGI